LPAHLPRYARGYPQSDAPRAYTKVLERRIRTIRDVLGFSDEERPLAEAASGDEEPSQALAQGRQLPLAL
jgi:hypothetical protein